MYLKRLISGLGIGLLLLGTAHAMAYEVKKDEELDYKVIVKSIIHGGNQRIKILNQNEIYRGTPAIRVRSIVKSVGIVKQLTGYAESEELLLDAAGLYPLNLKREVKDGKDTELEEVHFDYRNKVALQRRIYSDKTETQKEIPLPGRVYDSLALQFFLRKPDLQSGSHQLYFYSYGSGAIEAIDYAVRDMHQTLQVGENTVPDYVQIESPKAKITVLVSNDAKRVPLLIRKITKFGKFEAKLERGW